MTPRWPKADLFCRKYQYKDVSAETFRYVEINGAQGVLRGSILANDKVAKRHSKLFEPRLAEQNKCEVMKMDQTQREGDD